MHYDVVPSSSVYIEMNCASPSVVLVLEAERSSFFGLLRVRGAEGAPFSRSIYILRHTPTSGPFSWQAYVGALVGDSGVTTPIKLL